MYVYVCLKIFFLFLEYRLNNFVTVQETSTII